MKFSDTIRKALLDSPVTRYRLSKRMHCGQSALSDFANGRNWIGEELLDRLARELGLRVVVDGPSKSKRS